MMTDIIELIELEGPWKRKNLAEFGIVTQCIAPTRVNDQYITNVLLKINAKVRVPSIWFCAIILSIFFFPPFLASLKSQNIFLIMLFLLGSLVV